jgi:peptidoglycan-associated lipoprotein
MKRAHFCQLIALSLVLSVGLLGCKKSPKDVTHIPGRTGPSVPESSTPGPLATRPDRGVAIPRDDGTQSNLVTRDGQTPMPGERWDRGNFNEDREQFSGQTIYFDFDQSVVKESELSKIQAVASYLRTEPRTMLYVEGHCDERGTAEYNRALGERRAQAIREHLIALDLIGERIETISYGEDRPADPGHDETAWAKNRRGEFILLRPKQ